MWWWGKNYSIYAFWVFTANKNYTALVQSSFRAEKITRRELI
jgi:hypothetical protein